VSLTWHELQSHLRVTLSLDTEWTVERDASLDWWGWLFPQRIELCDVLAEPHAELITGTIRISARVARVRPEGLDQVKAMITDWNQDAPGSIAVLDYDGMVHLVWGVPILPGRKELALNLTVGIVARQSAYAVVFARLLSQNQLIEVAGQPHPELGIRNNPDELVALYIGECNDSFTTKDYESPEVLRALKELMEAEGFELGFSSPERGITTFELADGYTHVGMQFDTSGPESFVQAGPMLRIRAGAGQARAFPPSHEMDAIDAAVRANRRVWNRQRTSMLGAWTPSPDRTGSIYLSLSSAIPASSLIFDPSFTPFSYAKVLRDLLIVVMHQTMEAAQFTYDD